VSDGVESIEQALAILDDDPRHDVQRAGLLLSSARVHMLNGRQSLGTEVAARAHATAEPAATAGDRLAAEILVQALLIAATCRTTGGDETGLALFAQARAQADGFVRAMMRYYINYSNSLMLLGRYDDAVAVAREGQEYGRTHVADLGPLVMLQANMIEAHIYAGRLRQAEELGGLLPLVEPGLYSAFLRERLVCLAIWRGRIDGAQAALEAARRELDMFGAYEFQTRFGLAYDLGELALARGDAREALSHARAAWETPAVGVLALPLTAVAARAVAMLRERGEDADIEPYRAVLGAFAEWPVTPLWAAVFAAELGEGSWAPAVDAIGPAYIRAYARVRHGEALLAEGDRTAAREVLTAAASFAEELGADGLVARAREVMTDAGLAGEAPRSVLTSREEQVLELVAEGLTNGQIAERLYISAKTVSVHVSAILRKLDAPSRTAAAAIHRRSAA
jgi:DNA-binding CsgD family transcriptional regulator